VLAEPDEGCGTDPGASDAETPAAGAVT
jgi:hypothetical protein